MTDLNAFSTTHYHIPQDVAVERATKEEMVTIIKFVERHVITLFHGVIK